MKVLIDLINFTNTVTILVQLKGTPHWLEISNIGQILEIYWTNIGDLFNKFPINLQYSTNIGHNF